MINPKDTPVDVEEVRLWAVGYREFHEPALSWAMFAKECGIPAGTLQPFCTGNYQGDNQRVAKELFRFRQAVESQRERQQAIPTDPGYFDTETSVRIQMLLQMAHLGRITVIATGPGTGKTVTVREYMERAQPVYYATMRPSCTKVLPMLEELHRAFGIESRHHTSASASRQVIDRVKGRKALIIVDESNHLSIDSIEELRSLHDATGVGICLLGNEELLQRIETGRMRDRFARLNSRIAMRHVQRLPLKEDVHAFCDAWNIKAPDIRKYLEKIALTPDAGGLRECRQLIEAGSLLAADDDRGLTISDLRDAQLTRATRWIAA